MSSLPGYDRWKTSGPGGPDDDQTDWCYTRLDVAGIEALMETLKFVNLPQALSNDMVNEIGTLRTKLGDHLIAMREDGIEPEEKNETKASFFGAGPVSVFTEG